MKFLSPKVPPPAIRKAMAKAVERRQKGLPVFDFSSGNVGNLVLNQTFFENFELRIKEGLPPELKMLAEGLKEGIIGSYYPSPQGFAYSPAGGTESIKKLVIRYFREVHGLLLVNTDTNRVIVTAGGQQAMAASLRSVRAGTRVLLSRWEYAPIPGILRDGDLVEVRIELNEDFSINMESLKEEVDKGSVFYISMPNNPTGYFSPEDLEDIVEILSVNEGGVVWDAPYLFTILKITKSGAEFDGPLLKEKLTELKEMAQKYCDHMCILSSLSKTCLIAGLRFGFATANEHWIENMSSIIGRENLSSPTPSFIAGAAVLQRFLETPLSHEWVCRVLADRLTVLMEEIPDYLMLPRNGMFGALYVLVSTNDEGTKVADNLIKDQGIVTVPANQFYGDKVKAIRLSLVSVPWSEGDEAWIQSVSALKKALT